MNPSELLDILTENISFRLRHANYDRTLEVKKTAKMISASIGWEDEITRYRRFEIDELKEQRIRLHNPPTKSALAAPRRYFKRMPRVEGIRRTFTTNNDKALTELKDDFYNFMPGESLEQWQNRTLEFLGVNDPNAWIIAERNDKRNVEGGIVKTKVYPFIVPCEDVLNFQKSFGTLDWLLVRTTQIERVATDKSRRDQYLETYYLYAPGYVIRAREIGEKTVIEKGEAVQAIPDFPATGTIINPALPGGATEIKYPTAPSIRKFYISERKNGSTEVLADCVGVYPDEETDMGTFVPWFDAALYDFKDLMRYKSFADNLLTTYAYPHTYEFAPKCYDRSEEYGDCDHGYYGGTRDLAHRCGNCKGTGIPASFTTEQQRVIMLLPEDGQNELMELAKLSHTQEIKIDLLVWVDGKIESTTAKIMNTLFGAGLFQRPNNATTKTATEVNTLTAGISDVLAPFGSVECRFYELFFRAGAQYRNFEITVDKSYPDDLQIELLPDMVMGFDQIKKAGVGYEATVAQRNRVFQKLFEGSPEIKSAIQARYKFKPWDDKNDEQVAQITAKRAATDPQNVLWENWLEIMMEIEDANPLFYQMTRKRQKEIVAAQVAIITAQIQEPNIDPLNAPNINQDNNANPGSTDAGAN